MKSRSKKYQKGIELIALNDETASTEIDLISGLFSVALLADIFSIKLEDVAKDVLKYRERYYYE